MPKSSWTHTDHWPLEQFRDFIDWCWRTRVTPSPSAAERYEEMMGQIRGPDAEEMIDLNHMFDAIAEVRGE